MSWLTTIENGLTNAEKFLISLATHGTQLAVVIGKFGPNILGAFTAVAYDVMKTIAAAEAQVAAGATGNFLGAIQLSPTTIALVKQVWADFKAGEAEIVAAFNALGWKF